jgi:hypothetical protein
MDKITNITKYFEDVETTKEHNGYFCSVGEALTIVILGSFCGLRNVNQIHQWASSTRVSEFLSKNFGIDAIPCYYWQQAADGKSNEIKGVSYGTEKGRQRWDLQRYALGWRCRLQLA